MVMLKKKKYFQEIILIYILAKVYKYRNMNDINI